MRHFSIFILGISVGSDAATMIVPYPQTPTMSFVPNPGYYLAQPPMMMGTSPSPMPYGGVPMQSIVDGPQLNYRQTEISAKPAFRGNYRPPEPNMPRELPKIPGATKGTPQPLPNKATVLIAPDNLQVVHHHLLKVDKPAAPTVATAAPTHTVVTDERHHAEENGIRKDDVEEFASDHGVHEVQAEDSRVVYPVSLVKKKHKKHVHWSHKVAVSDDSHDSDDSDDSNETVPQDNSDDNDMFMSTDIVRKLVNPEGEDDDDSANSLDETVSPEWAGVSSTGILDEAQRRI